MVAAAELPFLKSNPPFVVREGVLVLMTSAPVIVSPPFLTKLLLDQKAVLEAFETVGNTVLDVLDKAWNILFEVFVTFVLVVAKLVKIVLDVFESDEKIVLDVFESDGKIVLEVLDRAWNILFEVFVTLVLVVAKLVKIVLDVFESDGNIVLEVLDRAWNTLFEVFVTLVLVVAKLVKIVLEVLDRA